MAPPPSNGTSTPNFLETAFNGNLKRLKRLVLELGDHGDGLGATVACITNSYGRTVLHSAAAGGKTHVCKYLIEELKLDVNIKDAEGETPLHHATVLIEHVPTATYLLEKGANPTAANGCKVTALHYAAEKGHKKLLRLLISKGAVVDAEALTGTPLHWVSMHGKKEAVKILLENNANVNKMITSYFVPRFFYMLESQRPYIACSSVLEAVLFCFTVPFLVVLFWCSMSSVVYTISGNWQA